MLRRHWPRLLPLLLLLLLPVLLQVLLLVRLLPLQPLLLHMLQCLLLRPAWRVWPPLETHDRTWWRNRHMGPVVEMLHRLL